MQFFPLVNSCEDPGKIKNGDRSFESLNVNSTVSYICDEGYELRGKSTLLCMENGKWDLDKLPICKCFYFYTISIYVYAYMSQSTVPDRVIYSS